MKHNYSVNPEYIEYLRDESRIQGEADTISFPQSPEEIREDLHPCMDQHIPVTVQGARTGITGGAVPQGGHICNVSRMNKVLGAASSGIDGAYLVRVQPGVLLCDFLESLDKGDFDTSFWPDDDKKILDELRSKGPFFFPPDPTETSASLGGMISCNASGARTFSYGSTRKYVQDLSVELISGAHLDLHRGGNHAEKLSFSLTSVEGRTFSGKLPGYRLPPIKSAAGLFAEPEMDLIDLFIGSEGTLGVITEANLIVIPKPRSIWGIAAFFPDQESSLSFVQKIRKQENKPAALEFFNHRALNLLRDQKKANPAFGELPEIDGAYHTAVYVEYHGNSDDETEEMVYALAELMVECGSSEDATWIADSEKELVKLKDFRHAVPEAVNLLIDNRRKSEPGLTKLGTDMAVGDDKLEEVMHLYDSGLSEAGLESVIFGHIGNNHLHVNILPKSLEEYEKGKELYLQWAENIVSMGGTVSAEHGIGKLKTGFLKKMFGEEGVRQMEEVINVFNQGKILNRGNIVP